MLNDFDLDLFPGEVHGLVGMNGSGKSTLIKLLAGYHAPDPGSSVSVQGVEVEIADTQAAHHLGLRFVHQDLGLVEVMSAVENLYLGGGFPSGPMRRIDWRRARRQTEDRLHALGFSFDVGVPIGQLSSAERTGIAIARALLDDERAKVLVLDEPTASLNMGDAAVLFSAVARLKESGVGVLFVSHHLEEVFDTCDRVTVLRDGVKVATYKVDEIDRGTLVQAMTGGVVLEAHRGSAEVLAVDPVMTATRLCGEVVDNVSLVALPGKVLGVAGLTGSGRDELLSMIFGALSRAGEVSVDGCILTSGKPAESVAAGVAFVPADRHADGAVGSMSVRENITLADLRSLGGALGFLSVTREREHVDEWIERLSVHPPNSEAVFSTLSGGNQQKVVLAKWLRAAPRLLLLDDPTQGVDVRAKAMIHSLIRQAATEGLAVVVASSDDRELCQVCDEVLVMIDGRVGEVLAGSALTLERLTRAQLRGPRATHATVA